MNHKKQIRKGLFLSWGDGSVSGGRTEAEWQLIRPSATQRITIPDLLPTRSAAILDLMP